MCRAESDADKSRLRDSPTYQATFKELLSLRARSIRLIQRQVEDLKAGRTMSEQEELLGHLDLSISIAISLSRYANACARDPFAINDPELKRILIDSSLLLSQHEDRN